MVVEPDSDGPSHDTRLKLPKDATLRGMKGPLDVALPRVLKARLDDEGAHLHPRSAVQRRAHTGGRYEKPASYDYCSCPTSPVSLPGPPPLRLDTRPSGIDYRYLEIAMEVAEEVARICDSPGPLPTDVPLLFSGIDVRTVGEFKTWLMVRYNYRGHARRLMDEAVTPEVLALDILGMFSITWLSMTALTTQQSAPQSLTSARCAPVSSPSPLRAHARHRLHACQTAHHCWRLPNHTQPDHRFCSLMSHRIAAECI